MLERYCPAVLPLPASPAPCAAAFEMVLAVTPDVAASASGPDTILAVPSMSAEVSTSRILTATLAPAADEPLASALLVLDTVLFAVKFSAPVTWTSAEPPIWTRAVLPALTTAADASATSEDSAFGAAVALTVVEAVACRFAAPPTTSLTPSRISTAASTSVVAIAPAELTVLLTLASAETSSVPVAVTSAFFISTVACAVLPPGFAVAWKIRSLPEIVARNPEASPITMLASPAADATDVSVTIPAAPPATEFARIFDPPSRLMCGAVRLTAPDPLLDVVSMMPSEASVMELSASKVTLPPLVVMFGVKLG